MIPKPRLPFLTLALLSITVVLAGCNSNDEEEDGGGGPATDVTPPNTVALPPGGTYAGAQTVTLTSNEAATIHFTIDGSTPIPGNSSTVSGPSPQGGIQITTSPSVLKFYAVDTAGNVEFVKTQAYTLDGSIPSVTIASPTPPPLGLLGTTDIAWSSSESGTFRVELGGTGTPGTGALLTIGTVIAAAPQTFPLRATQLTPGPAQTVWFIVVDGASNFGKASVTVSLKPLRTMLYQGDVRDIAITIDGKHAYVANASTNAVNVIDIDPSSASFHQVLAAPVPGVDPSSVTMTPDGTRAYAGSLPGVSAINTSNQGITPIGIPGGFEVHGIDVTPDGKRGYFGRGQSLFVVDTDPLSASFHAAQSTGAPLFGLVAADVELTPSGLLAVVPWTGPNSYTVNIVDTNPLSPTFHTVIGTPVPSANSTFAHVAISPDGAFAYVADGTGALARINLGVVPFAVDLSNAALSVDSVLVSGDGTALIVLERGFNALRVVRAGTLSLVDNFPWALCGEVGAVTPNGQTAYVIRNDSSAIQELVAIPLL
ncbi:MAG: chitobiase/beta-hexosaminidase C-terminal domain-containing protein [Planctomycetota bacterium]